MTLAQSEEKNFLKRLTEITEANLSNERFGVSELARKMGMSHSNLHRKVKKVHGSSISLFIRHVRLKKAIELLKLSSLTVSEVAFECGFHSVSYFSKCFHDHYGYPPGEAGKIEAEKQDVSDLQHLEQKQGTSNKRLIIIALGSALLIVTFFVLLFIFKPFTTRNQFLDKSIAVLPFINDSPEETEMYFINGTMEAILNNLSRIKDLRVPSRTSVEQYRNNPKPIPVIASEMNVSYILEGSGQKLGNNIRLTLQLLDAINDRHIWSKTYDREIREVEELFALQSEIAQLVAAEIKAIVTPVEKQLIEKVPTMNLTAYYFYQRGREKHIAIFRDFKGIKQTLDRAKVLYLKALDHDSTYAKAYSGLAFFNLHYYQFVTKSLEKVYLDSALIFADIALSYDNQEADAYVVKGYYFWFNNRFYQAIEQFDKALRYNPGCAYAYQGKGWSYFSEYNFVGALDNFLKSLSYDRGPNLPIYLRNIGMVYNYTGFKEEAQYYFEEALKLDDDSISHSYNSVLSEFLNGHFSRAIEIWWKGYSIDSFSTGGILINLGYCYLLDGQIEESLKYTEKYIEGQRALGQFTHGNINRHVVGYYFWQKGNKEEAEYHFNKGIKRSEEYIQKKWAVEYEIFYYELAAIHAFRGEENEAYENLRLLNQRSRMASWIPTFLKNDPFFDSIRDDPEFQQIVSDVENKYLAEHERVRKWLEDQEML